MDRAKLYNYTFHLLAWPKRNWQSVACASAQSNGLRVKRAGEVASRYSVCGKKIKTDGLAQSIICGAYLYLIFCVLIWTFRIIKDLVYSPPGSHP